MADEPQGDATATQEPGTPPAPDQQAAAPAPPERDWQALLDEAPDDIIAKHRRVQGIAGSHAERLFTKRQQEWTAEQQAKAAEAAREELRREAQENPLAFADRFLSHDDAEKARERIASVERNAAKNLMEQIGSSYHGLPEWAELNDDEKAKLRQAVDGAPDNDVLPRFNRAALDIVADRRADKRLQDRLPKEQEAWRKQWEAERLAGEQGPDLRTPSSTTRRALNWGSMDDKEFDKWWKQKYG